MIFEFNSTESVPAHDLKRRILQVFADVGEPMSEVTYDALTKRVAALEAENASLRLTLGGKTFSADVPSPIGCPKPGACAQVEEIHRLRRALAEATKK